MSTLRNQIQHILLEMLEVANQIIQQFELETFRELRSFNQRIKYCQQSLIRLSSGSSRIVYDLGNGKVLKIARNRIGLVQNQHEFDLSEDWVFSNYEIITNVFDGAENGEWIISEKAEKMTKPLFKKVTGYGWDEFIQALYAENQRINGTKPNSRFEQEALAKLIEKIWEDEDSLPYRMFSMIGSYPDLLIGDLAKLNSWGVVKRKGKLHAVLIDYGITQKDFDSLYK